MRSSTDLMVRLNHQLLSICTSDGLVPGLVIERPPQSPRCGGPLGYGCRDFPHLYVGCDLFTLPAAHFLIHSPAVTRQVRGGREKPRGASIL